MSPVRRLLPSAALLALAACDPVGLPASPPALTPGVDETALTRRELLGKRLFEDTTLSEPAGQACASCHDAARAFAGNAGSPVPAVARGAITSRLGTRNVPTLLYASYSPPFQYVADDAPDGGVRWIPVGGQFWDGRAADLEAQALGPLLNPREMNNADADAVLAKVRARPYAALFAEVCGAASDTAQAYACLGASIAAFERTDRFRPFSSRFDRMLAGELELTALEARGFDVFKDPTKGNCIACHAGDPTSRDSEDWLFTDFTYDVLGAPRNAAIPDNADPGVVDLGLCAQEGLAGRAPPSVDLARSCGAFKVPTLRNVAVTAPYFHNGVFETLEDALRFYATRDTEPGRWYPAAADGGVDVFDDLRPEHRGNVNRTEVPYDRRPGEAARLSDDDLQALKAFLETLTDEGAAPALLANPTASN